jgi:LmbE family N-acetylglucosaminyl deacetylase
MIHSLVSDDVWLDYFQRMPTWEPTSRPTIILAPHPDDETLGAGALIASLRARDVSVWVIAATDGENCYDLPLEDRVALGRIREIEQRDALSRLGVEPDHIIRLRLTDSGLHLQESELADRLSSFVQPGMHLIAPWSGDFHPDHEACARAAATVARDNDAELISYFFWTWHRGTPDLLHGKSAVRFLPDAKAARAKREALQEHRSQLEHATFEPILPERLLGPANWPFEVFLPS